MAAVIASAGRPAGERSDLLPGAGRRQRCVRLPASADRRLHEKPSTSPTGRSPGRPQPRRGGRRGGRLGGPDLEERRDADVRLAAGPAPAPLSGAWPQHPVMEGERLARLHDDVAGPHHPGRPALERAPGNGRRRGVSRSDPRAGPDPVPGGRDPYQRRAGAPAFGRNRRVARYPQRRGDGALAGAGSPGRSHPTRERR